MLKLINIKLKNDLIEADYIPEQSKSVAHARLNTVTDDYTIELIEEYGEMYQSMALCGLRRLVNDFQSGKIPCIPKEKTIMWY